MEGTILLTGVSGFIAKRVALKLLQAGYEVRGTLRRMDRAAEVTAALKPALDDPQALSRLSFAGCDLTADDGWEAAMDGVGAVVHTASPLPLAEPKLPDELIRPALQGTRRVLRAAQAAGVRRVVMTSSVAAVHSIGATKLHDEADWVDPDAPEVTTYARSKVLAERAAWDFVAGDGVDMQLTTINPGVVAGPPLDVHFGSSIALVQRLLRGKDPMVPDMRMSIVDVRDVAEMHLRALQRPETAGRRYIAAAGVISLVEAARVLKAAFPDRRIATRQAPRLLIKAVAMFDPEMRAALPRLGQDMKLTAQRAEREMGMHFIPPEEALRATGAWLLAHGAV